MIISVALATNGKDVGAFEQGASICDVCLAAPAARTPSHARASFGRPQETEDFPDRDSGVRLPSKLRPLPGVPLLGVSTNKAYNKHTCNKTNSSPPRRLRGLFARAHARVGARGRENMFKPSNRPMFKPPFLGTPLSSPSRHEQSVPSAEAPGSPAPGRTGA